MSLRSGRTGKRRALQSVYTHDEPSPIYLESVVSWSVSGSVDFLDRITHRLLYDRCGSGLADVVAHSVATHRIVTPYGRESSLFPVWAARWSTRGHYRPPPSPDRLPACDGHHGRHACDLKFYRPRDALDL